MKTVDRLLAYPALGSGTAVCHLRVYTHAAKTIAIVGELTDNQSTSVTNAIEEILSILREEYGRNVLVVEHYPADDTVLRPQPTWDVVTGGQRGRAPLWERLAPLWRRLPSTRDLESLIGEPVETWHALQDTAATLRAQGRT